MIATMVQAIRLAGSIHLAIIAANVPCLAPMPRFIRQIFYVHWIYIVPVFGLFSALCLYGICRASSGAGIGGSGVRTGAACAGSGSAGTEHPEFAAREFYDS
jgi:hypothetical protein